MNQLILLCLSLCFYNANFAQNVKTKNVPNVIKLSFEKIFPYAEVEQWEKEDSCYEVEFECNDTNMTALFDLNGGLVETEQQYSLSQLPVDAKAYIDSHPEYGKVKDVFIIKRGKEIIYEVEFKKIDLVFNVIGDFIQIVSDND